MVRCDVMKAPPAPARVISLILWGAAASGFAALPAGAAETQTKPIACALDQLDETQRQVAAEAYLTTDALPRRAAGKALRDALEACSGFSAMTDAQVGLANDYTQSAVVLELIETRLSALKAPSSLVDTVWTTLDANQKRAALDFARNRAPEAESLSKAIIRLVGKAGGNTEMIDPVTMGVAARAIMDEVQGRW
jgi:hypothetical protein